MANHGRCPFADIRRPCRLEPETLKTVDGWLGDYRSLWEHRLDRLEGYLATLNTEEKEEQK